LIVIGTNSLEDVMRKTMAAALLAAGITVAPVVHAVEARTFVATTPTTTIATAATPAAPATSTNNDDSDSKVGLWGLLGLLGLGGLAGLKRRDVRSGTAAAYGNGAGYTTTGQTGVTRP
jgi:hypothetical protein